MEEFLYKNTSNSNIYFITMYGDYFNYAIDLSSFNNKIISKEELNNYIKIPFNETNIKEILKDLNVSNIKYINFDEFSKYNYIYYKTTIIKINNWRDFSNFIATII